MIAGVNLHETMSQINILEELRLHNNLLTIKLSITIKNALGLCIVIK